MAYATRSDLEARYAQEIAQREEVLPALGLENALADADAEIDGYLSVRYGVPLSPVPTNIRRVACVIARYRLLGDAVSEAARQDYKDALSFLRDIAVGRARLEGAPTLATSPEARTVQMVSGSRIFGRSES